nr:hypothetical protein [Marinicella sp. W31]MDC2876245.1 hypothetical protein [Marinicella sp. W31]
MFEYLPLIAFQAAFATAGLTILYRIVGGRFVTVQENSHRAPSKLYRKRARD